MVSNLHIAKYRKIRKYHEKIGNQMLAYFQKHEQDFKQSFTDNVFNSKNYKMYNLKFDLSIAIDKLTFIDIVLYQLPNNLCKQFIDEKLATSTQDTAFINAMLTSQMGLFQISSIDKKSRLVTFENILSGELITIIDESMSKSDIPEHLIIFMRVITYDGISFQTGLTYVFRNDDPRIRKWIKRHKQRRLHTKEFIELFQMYLENQKKDPYLIKQPHQLIY